MQKSGFTLVEVLVTIFILAIVIAIGVPSYQSMIRGSAMSSNSSDILTSFNYARIEAIKRATSVQLTPQTHADWSSGLVVWLDSDEDGVLDNGEELRIWETFASGTSVNSSNAATGFVFNAMGEVNQEDQLTLCDDRVAEQGRVISVLVSGATYAEKVTCG